MNQSIPDRQSQEQDNLIKDTNVGRDLTYAPVQIGTKIDTQTIIQQITRTEVTQRELVKNSPYKGLERFNFSDNDHFFGRDKLIADLIKRVTQSSLTVVLGASGSGKSSVVRAGLIPKLKKSLSQTFYGFIFTPTKDPFNSLYQCLVNDEKDYSFSESKAKIALEAKADTLTQVINTLKKDEEFWLIFVDQFEELFTSCNHSEKRKNFISGLVQVAKSGNSSVKIVLAMRSDFLEQFSSYPDIIEITNQNNIHLVTEMHPDELRQAIEAPAAKHGVVFQEGLVEQIIKEVEGQKGYLPLLQYTLKLLWESECKTLGVNGRPEIEDQTLNKKTYEVLEGVRGALKKRVDEIYSPLNQDEQTTTKQIFLKLVNIVETDSGSRTVSRRADRDEFASEESVEKILKQFIDENLLVSSSEFSSLEEIQVSGSKHLKPSATVEIAHEILLSSWEELKDWLQEEKEAIILKNWLTGETKRWQKICSENKIKNNKFKAQNKLPHDELAHDELLKGSQLVNVLEFREKDAFKNVGGLSTEQEEFIKVSVGWRDRQEKEKEAARQRELIQAQELAEKQRLLVQEKTKATRKLRRLVYGLVVVFLGAAGAGVFAVIQLHNVKVANQRRQEELIQSAWISLKPLKESFEDEECGTRLDFGFRDLYCKISMFVSYSKLRVISGLPVFNKGPHTDSGLNFQGGYEFGYYNPEFLKWIQEKVINPNGGEFKDQIQPAYNNRIRVVARAFYQTHKILFATPQEFEAFKKQYKVVQKRYQERLKTGEVNEGRFYNEPIEFEEIKSTYLVRIQNKSVPAEGMSGVGFMLTEDCRWLADYLTTQNEIALNDIKGGDDYWYLAHVSGGFWVRRSIDGTEKQFFDILTKLLRIYDGDWLRQQESLEIKPSR
jgi:energy-coupling factor transporter ATP-binding protein EcfA2